MRKILFWGLLFLVACQQKKVSHTTLVALQPYKGFSKEKTDTLAQTITNFYNVKTIILPAIDLPQEAFIQVKSARYRADSLIKIQKKIHSDSIDYVLGLTHKDISTTKRDKTGKTKQPTYKYEDWGIMGLAYCPGTSSIVSSFRLQHKDKKRHFTRIKKVTIHELGHNLGLPHCPNKNCVMTDAVENITTIDNASLALCKTCKQKIQ